MKHSSVPLCKCGETRAEEFYGHTPRKCKACCRSYASKHLKANRGPANERKRSLRRQNGPAIRESEQRYRIARAVAEGRVLGATIRRRPYDRRLTLLRLLTEQGNACAICKVNTPGRRRGWHLDHDHGCCRGDVDTSCGRCLRGVLCARCNPGVGLLGDDPARLRAAAEYLERHSKPVPPRSGVLTTENREAHTLLT